MQIIRAVFEKGIELRLAENLWTISSAPPASKAAFKSIPDAVTALSPLRLLLITDKRGYGDDLTLLLRCNSRDYFGLCVSELMNRSHSAGMLYPVYQVVYHLGAIGYHCERLAELYAHIAIQFCQMTQIPGSDDKSDVCIYGYQTEPYYEFDALVGAVRQSYDSFRHILWKRFGRKGSTPRSLEKLLKERSNIPEKLHKRLIDSWQKYGRLLTLYRDCIHHYVPVDFGLASAIMRRNALHAWTTTVRIPDNPEVRSKEQFTFALNRDALTYAWEVADEVLGAAMDMIETAIPRKEDA